MRHPLVQPPARPFTPASSIGLTSYGTITFGASCLFRPFTNPLLAVIVALCLDVAIVLCNLHIDAQT